MRTERGYITAEAAIVLPLFIIAVVTVAFSMKLALFQEEGAFIAKSRIMELAKNEYTVPMALTFRADLESALRDELTEPRNTEVSNYLYRYGSGGGDNLIRCDVSFYGSAGMIDFYEVRDRFVTRAFVGKDNSKATSFGSFDEPEKSVTVWVFPEYGTKYHTEDCTYVHSYPSQAVLTKAVERKYSACPLCGAAKAKAGSAVYVFRYGGDYHTADCKAVTKYVITMEQADAEAKGYTPCSKCGGVVK